MTQTTFNYDEPSDTLYISFRPGQPATGIELNDHILLRVNKDDWTAVGLTIFDYSILARSTEVGPRSFPLTGLAELSPDTHERILNILRTPPVSDILTLSAYTPSLTDTIPIASLRATPLTPA